MTLSTHLHTFRMQAVNRHRELMFGIASLECFGMNPTDGEAMLVMFADGWCAYRAEGTTDGRGAEATGAWQFHVVAASDWVTTQLATFKKIVVLKVGSRRWKVNKLEQPIGLSLMWKIRAEIQ